MGHKLRWGVIGCGGIAARRTIPEMKRDAPSAEIISVMDVRADVAEAAARKFDIPHWCTIERDVLEQEIDAVYIASPPSVHCMQTVQAAAAGKHVLCEKPMALSLAEADEMERACNGAGVSFMLGFCMRNNVYNRKAKELVCSGALGRIVMARAQLTCWYPPMEGAWRQNIAVSGGGALIDMGTHCMDILEWIIGSPIVEVMAFQDQMVHSYATPVEDASTILMRFRSGAHGIIDNYFNVPDACSPNALELYGTDGSILAQGTIGQEQGGKMSSILQSQAAYDAHQKRELQITRQEHRLEGEGIYGRMVQSFSQSILEEKQSPVTASEGRHSVTLVRAIYQSAREKRLIGVEA